MVISTVVIPAIFGNSQKKNIENQTQINPEYCDLISDSNSADKCYYNAALQTSNESLCYKIKQNGPLDSYQRGECLSKVAVQKRTADICSKNDDITWADKCYFEVAILLKDPNICTKIVEKNSYDQWTTEKCLQGISK